MLNVTEAEGLRIASATDVGRKRTGNEDSHAVWVPEDAEERARRGVLILVADGMGGANAGEVASRLAAEVVLRVFREHAADAPEVALRMAVEAANSTIHEQAGSQADQRGMGTTCTAIAVHGRDVWLGHVGDSRAYLVRNGVTTRLTRDHSLVAELVERGHLTEEEAKHDPRRNVVTRSVGATDDVVVDAEHMAEPLRPGDSLVLCSDGLHGQVTDEEIGRVTGESTPEEACERLIGLANDRGGPDNITVIVARAAGGDALTPGAKPAAAAAKPPGRMPLPLLVLAFLVAVAAVIAVGGKVVNTLRGTPATSTQEPSEPAASGTASDAAPQSSATSASPSPVSTAPEAAASSKPAPPPAAGSASPAPAKTAQPSAAKPPAAAAAVTPAPLPVGTGNGTLFVMTRPFQPCDFFIDGKPYSEAVGFVRVSGLNAGAHSVKVIGRDGVAQFDIQLVSSGVIDRVAELPGADAVGDVEIKITGTSAARIIIDGAQFPTLAPCTVHGLAAGSHKVRAIGQGTKPQIVDVPVEVASHGSGSVEIPFTSSH